MRFKSKKDYINNVIKLYILNNFYYIISYSESIGTYVVDSSIEEVDLFLTKLLTENKSLDEIYKWIKNNEINL